MKLVLSLASALIVIFAAHDAFGQEKEFTDYNCALTLPDGWQMLTNLPPQPGLVAAFAKADKTHLVLLLVDKRKYTSVVVDDRFVSDFESGIEHGGGGKRVWGKFIEIDGIKGYERLGYLRAHGKTASILVQALPADGRVYALQGMRFDGDADKDAEIRKCFATFRFITPPAAPALSDSKGAAYQTGYFMGKLAVLALLIAAGVLIVRTITGRKCKQNPNRPPPLPPSR